MNATTSGVQANVGTLPENANGNPLAWVLGAAGIGAVIGGAALGFDDIVDFFDGDIDPEMLEQRHADAEGLKRLMEGQDVEQQLHDKMWHAAKDAKDAVTGFAADTWDKIESFDPGKAFNDLKDWASNIKLPEDELLKALDGGAAEIIQPEDIATHPEYIQKFFAEAEPGEVLQLDENIQLHKFYDDSVMQIDIEKMGEINPDLAGKIRGFWFGTSPETITNFQPEPFDPSKLAGGAAIGGGTAALIAGGSMAKNQQHADQEQQQPPATQVQQVQYQQPLAARYAGLAGAPASRL